MVFLDTNVLVYASLDQDRRKRSIAGFLVDEAIRSGNGFVSLQVLREFANVLFKKSGCGAGEIRRVIAGFHDLGLMMDSEKTLYRGLEIKERHGIQFYDALVVAAAEEAGCDTLYSENLADGAVYGSVRVVNPFKESAALVAEEPPPPRPRRKKAAAK